LARFNSYPPIRSAYGLRDTTKAPPPIACQYPVHPGGPRARRLHGARRRRQRAKRVEVCRRLSKSAVVCCFHTKAAKYAQGIDA
jgi:hypothetical protein